MNRMSCVTAAFFGLAVASPLAAQTVRQQTDSIRRETCRGGTLSASGLSCRGATASPRVTVIRRLANRIDSLTGSVVPVPPPPPVDSGPPPPPDPVVLPTPTTTAPGSLTAPGPQVGLTPSFSWSSVTGATGYVVAIRDVNSGSFVYPSTTGVGPPVSGTSLVLPAGVLVAAGAYRWDVTAVNDTSKSLASADRYFTTAAPAPVNQKPVAVFNVTCVVLTCYFDGRASTDDQGIASYTWRSSDAFRPIKTGSAITREREPGGTGWTEWLIVADAAGLKDSTSHPVPAMPADTTPPPPPPPVDTTPLPPPPPPPTGSVVELPRVLLSFPYPTPSRSVAVPAGANLQVALDAAQGGDELVLAAGAAWTGNFTVTSCPASGWIILRTAGTIASGRMTPTKAANLAKIITPNTAPALWEKPGACRWRYVGVEVTMATSITAINYGLVRLEGRESVMDRMYVHGQATSPLARCATANGTRQEYVGNWLSNCHAAGYDAQAIWGAQGAGPFRIVNNYLEASGENIMFGGSDPSTPGLVPCDIEIRGNHITKPLAWKTAGWTVKNLMELKNACRVLVEGNVLDGSWSENGGSVIFKSSNQAGSCRWCRTTDVTFRRNRLINVGAGIAVAGSTNSDSTTKRILVTENTVDISQSSGYMRGSIQLAGTVDVSWIRNVFTGTTQSAALVEGGAPCRFEGNTWSKGNYGVFASGAGSGTAALTKGCGTGFVWINNTLIGTASSGYPAGTIWASAETPDAAAIRSTVASATAGVVVPP